MRILVVDDASDSLNVLSKLLARHNHDVATAQTLFTARVICENGQFDLVITDLGLPDGDGTELAELAARCGAKAIALTGRSTPEDIERSLKAGFCAHLTKPVTYEQVIDAMNSEPCETGKL
jgi:DNA-binding response OmpR family regulator